jgi:hypothetical protein
VNTEFLCMVLLLPLGVGLLTNEFYDWLPAWAEKIVRWTACKLPRHAQKRYEDDWLADLEDHPTGFSKLFFAFALIAGLTKLKQEINLKPRGVILSFSVSTSRTDAEIKEMLVLLETSFQGVIQRIESGLGRKLNLEDWEQMVESLDFEGANYQIERFNLE